MDSIWPCVPAPGARRILLVEDEAIIALAESYVLKNAGYAVDIAKSGETALAVIEGGQVPDLVLMDIDLGAGMDGRQAAGLILQRRSIPIVFLTSHATKDMVDRVRDITRYGYVVKNSGEFVLLSAIEMALELFEKERKIAESAALLRQAETFARVGYWFVRPGGEEIILSEGCRAILGLGVDACPFPEFQRHVLADDGGRREKAFRGLLEEGKAYDISYRFRRGDTGAVIPLHSSGRNCGTAIIGILQDSSEVERLLYGLREKEWRQAVTLKSIGDGVISTDVDGAVLEMNEEAERLTGWKSGAAEGHFVKEVFRIVNVSTRLPVENPIDKVLETGGVVGLANHTVLIAKDGCERHIADCAAPIRDDGGSILGGVLVFRDVSREYEARESLERNEEIFRTIFTASPTPFLLIDPATGRIEDANEAAESLYGWPLADLRRMKISDINTATPEEVQARMSVAVKGSRTEFHFTHRCADGRHRPMRVLSGPITIEGKTRLLSVILPCGEHVEA